MEKHMNWMYIVICWLILMVLVVTTLTLSLRYDKREHDRAFREYLQDRTDRGATNDTKR
jgi:hypothetical protein